MSVTYVEIKIGYEKLRKRFSEKIIFKKINATTGIEPDGRQTLIDALPIELNHDTKSYFI